MSRPVTNARLMGDPRGDKSRRRMHKTQAEVEKEMAKLDKDMMASPGMREEMRTRMRERRMRNEQA